MIVIDLAGVADALDMFPDWDENMRAEVYHAIDVAPEAYITLGDEDAYFKSEAHAAWERIRGYVVRYTTDGAWAEDLNGAAGGESAPTKDELLAALERGARMSR